MNKRHWAYYESEIGLIEIAGTEDGILSVDFVEDKSVDNPILPPLVKRCVKQLDEYFGGRRREFSVNLLPEGTDFQKKVWNELTKIPFGETRSYKDMAAFIGNIKAVRAVGNANGKNKIGILIPCHRVIGNNGKLVGYGGGLWRKEWLLKHERGGSASFPG